MWLYIINYIYHMVCTQRHMTEAKNKTLKGGLEMSGNKECTQKYTRIKSDRQVTDVEMHPKVWNG